MSISQKNHSIVSLLRDRELSLKYDPCFSSLKITSKLLRSDRKSLYNNVWKMTSKNKISCVSDYLYVSDYAQYCPLNAAKQDQPPLYKMEESNRKENVIDMISYVGKHLSRDIKNPCHCEIQQCTCLSQCILTLSEDHWLCQYSVTTGKLMKQIYVKVMWMDIELKFMHWDKYGERFILSSNRNSFHVLFSDLLPDAATIFAVFTTFPIEFYALIAIKRSVFGNDVYSVKISNQILYIGKKTSVIDIYNFDDFLKQGRLTSYNLGDCYLHFKVGSYPTCLPYNFSYSNAPPLLLRVRSFSDVYFGGHPCYFITINPCKISEYRINSIEKGFHASIEDEVSENFFSKPLNDLWFHPQESNKIFLKKMCTIDVFEINLEGSKPFISKAYTLGDLSKRSIELLKACVVNPDYRKKVPYFPSFILSYAYEHKLGIFAVLKFMFLLDTFIVLYDSKTGEEIQCILLKKRLIHNCEIYINLYTIVIMEGDCRKGYTAHVLMM